MQTTRLLSFPLFPSLRSIVHPIDSCLPAQQHHQSDSINNGLPQLNAPAAHTATRQSSCVGLLPGWRSHRSMFPQVLLQVGTSPSPLHSFPSTPAHRCRDSFASPFSTCLAAPTQIMHIHGRLQRIDAFSPSPLFLPSPLSPNPLHPLLSFFIQ